MSTRQRILYFLYSTPNIVGSLLGILGLLLYFLGVIDRFWLLIVIGLYGIGYLAAPRSQTYQLRLKQELSIDEIRTELEKLIQAIRRKVPKEILEKVTSIKNSILEILPYLSSLDGSEYYVYNIRQTALEYLPEALEYYMNLPRAYSNIHPIKDGKTAKQLLLEQLNLLDQEMKAIAADFYRNDTERLIAHGRFLEEKFQRPDAIFGISS